MNIKEAAESLSKLSKDSHIRWPGIWDDKKILQTCGATVVTYRKDEGFDFDAALKNLVERYGVASTATPTSNPAPVATINHDVAESKSVQKSSEPAMKSPAPKKKLVSKSKRSRDASDSESSDEAFSEGEETSDSEINKKKKAKTAAKPKEIAKKPRKKIEAVISHESAAADAAAVSSPLKEGGAPEEPKHRKEAHCVREENHDIASALVEMASIYFKAKDPRKGGVFSKAAKAIRECETAIKTKKEAMALKGIGKGIAGYIEEFRTTGMIARLEEMRAGMA